MGARLPQRAGRIVSAPDDDIDLRPILGVIARAWRRIHPLDLTQDEAFSLLTTLMQITNRLNEEQGFDEMGPLPSSSQHRAASAGQHRPALRLVREDGGTTE